MTNYLPNTIIPFRLIYNVKCVQMIIAELLLFGDVSLTLIYIVPIPG